MYDHAVPRSQINDAYCGPASAVTVLNTLGVGQPKQTADSGLDSKQYAYYDQQNVFDRETEKVKKQVDVREEVSVCMIDVASVIWGLTPSCPLGNVIGGALWIHRCPPWGQRDLQAQQRHALVRFPRPCHLSACFALDVRDL